MILTCDEGTLSLQRLADTVRLSPYHFCRAFRVSTGVPPHRFLIRTRMERARALLAGKMSITEIASDCGYQSSQAFARVFRKEVGTTPADYRRETLG